MHVCNSVQGAMSSKLTAVGSVHVCNSVRRAMSLKITARQHKNGLAKGYFELYVASAQSLQIQNRHAQCMPSQRCSRVMHRPRLTFFLSAAVCRMSGPSSATSSSSAGSTAGVPEYKVIKAHPARRVATGVNVVTRIAFLCQTARAPVQLGRQTQAVV